VRNVALLLLVGIHAAGHVGLLLAAVWGNSGFPMWRRLLATAMSVGSVGASLFAVHECWQ